jgi:hypothetical protein
MRKLAVFPINHISCRIIHRFRPNVHRGQISSWSLPMLKERVGAEQLADMIGKKINVSGVEISVRKDHAFGWMPTILSSPGDPIGYQRRAEEIARYLRVQFDLRE